MYAIPMGLVPPRGAFPASWQSSRLSHCSNKEQKQREAAVRASSNSEGISLKCLGSQSRASRAGTDSPVQGHTLPVIVCELAAFDIWHRDHTTALVLAIPNGAGNLQHSQHSPVPARGKKALRALPTCALPCTACWGHRAPICLCK